MENNFENIAPCLQKLKNKIEDKFIKIYLYVFEKFWFCIRKSRMSQKAFYLKIILKLLFTAAKIRIRQLPKPSHKGNDDKPGLSMISIETALHV